MTTPILEKKKKKKPSKKPVVAMQSKMNQRAVLPRIRTDGAVKKQTSTKETKLWLDQLDCVFDRTVTPVSMPLFKDLFPCPTTIVANVGSTNIVMTNAALVAQFWPNGAVASNSQNVSANTVFSAGTGRIGPNLDSTSTRSTAGAYVQTTQAGAEGLFTNPLTNTMLPFYYDPLIAPFHSGNLGLATSTGMQFRTAAFGVRFSYVGKLADTEGYVEWYAPYEVPLGNSLVIRSLRRDPSYRRCYFSDQRTFEFYWEPTCDDIEFSQDFGDANLVSAVNCRHFAIVGGLVAGDKLEVEYVTIQDWTGHRGISTAKPVYVTPNPSALANTILATHGSMNPILSEGKEVKGIDKWAVLEKLVSGATTAADFVARMSSHPGAKKVAKLLLGSPTPPF